MKTLGETLRQAYYAHNGDPMDDADHLESWGKIGKFAREGWETAAQAVRAAVIDECAKRIEGEYTGAVPYSGEWESRMDDERARVNQELGASIRSLK